VQTTERTDWYAVGVSDTSGAHDLVVEYCKAHLGHAVRLERPLTDREITEFLVTKRAESRPAEGKTNPENFYGVDRHGPPWEADERKMGGG